MKNFKKIIAGVSAITLLALNAGFMVNAAAPVATISGTDITITSAGNLAAEVVTLVLKQDTVERTITTDYTIDTTVAWTIKITSVIWTALDTDSDSNVDSANYEISYTTAAWEKWAVVINNWTSHTVNVTATVAPILTMSLNTNDASFGELAPGVAQDRDIIVTTASNAKSWITVSTAATGLASWNTTDDKHIWNLQRTDSVATVWTDTYTIASVDTNTSWGLVLASQNVAGTQNVLTADDVTKSNATTTVTLSAEVDALTEAGSYTDVLTFTVTGNF